MFVSYIVQHTGISNLHVDRNMHDQFHLSEDSSRPNGMLSVAMLPY